MASEKSRKSVDSAHAGNGKVDSAWVKAISKAILHRGDVIPPGWYTFNEIRVMMGRNNISRNRTRCIMRELLKSGGIEIKSFKVMKGEKLVALPYYRLLN